MASFEKRGKKWRAVVSYANGQGDFKKVTSTFDTQREAKLWAAKEEVKVKNGYDPDKSKMTFSNYYIEWLKTYKQPTVRISSMKKYQTYAKNITAMFDELKLSQITPSVAQERIIEFGNTHSLETTKNITTTIKSSLKDAYVDGYIERDVFGRLKAVSSKKQASIQNYLDAQEFESLQDYLYATIENSDRFHLLVLLAIETGARFGELLALTRTDFNSDKNEISITKSYSSGAKMVTKPKNKSSIRIIPISSRLTKTLTHYLNRHNGLNLFSYWSNQTVQNNLRRILKSAGVHQIRFHGLRHSHVSYLLHNGVDIDYISKRVGHSNIGITLSVYSHMLKEKEQTQRELALNILDKVRD
ncbi:tyrosine-type recombinase/integrase [Leuconostoc pseudomesenteroides]|uniref:tyrosine-type recombinase/integrase n=1 Tax=Leuconostoc pseudomesenteroides TaxID=33968 RepID=UPI0039EA15D7